jgi:hypothetical protein
MKERNLYIKDRFFFFFGGGRAFLCCCSMSGYHPINDFVLMATSFENLEKTIKNIAEKTLEK